MHACIYNQMQYAGVPVYICDKDEGEGRKVARKKSKTPDFLVNIILLGKLNLGNSEWLRAASLTLILGRI